MKMQLIGRCVDMWKSDILAMQQIGDRNNSIHPVRSAAVQVLANFVATTWVTLVLTPYLRMTQHGIWPNDRCAARRMRGMLFFCRPFVA